MPTQKIYCEPDIDSETGTSRKMVILSRVPRRRIYASGVQFICSPVA
jgi:hypothetical protein